MKEDEFNVEVVDEEELEQQRRALIAVLSCETTYNCTAAAISQAILSQALATRTKFQHSNLSHTFCNSKKTNIAGPDFQTNGSVWLSNPFKHPAKKISSEMNASPHVLNVIKALKSNNVHALVTIDVTGMLLGDTAIADVCMNIKGSTSIHSLILCGNNISDAGLKSLGDVITSLSEIGHLNLADNTFSDDGLRHILCRDVFPKTLVSINLLRNDIGFRTAYWIGEKFDGRTDYRLTSVSLGGRKSHLSSGLGDEFLNILVSFFCAKGAKPLTQLSYVDGELSRIGIRAACLLLVNTKIETLNLSGNSLSESVSLFSMCLRWNTSLKRLIVYRCGLSMLEHQQVQDSINLPKMTLSWRSRVDLAEGFSETLFAGYRSRLNVFKQFGSALDPDIIFFLSPGDVKLRSSSSFTPYINRENALVKGHPDYHAVVKLSRKRRPKPLLDMLSDRRVSVLSTVLQSCDSLRHTIEDLRDIVQEVSEELHRETRQEIQNDMQGQQNVSRFSTAIASTLSNLEDNLLNNYTDSAEELIAFEAEELYTRLLLEAESLEERIGAIFSILVAPKIDCEEAERNLKLLAPDPTHLSTILIPLSDILDPFALHYGYYAGIIRPKIIERRKALVEQYELNRKSRLEKKSIRERRVEKYHSRKERLSCIVGI